MRPLFWTKHNLKKLKLYKIDVLKLSLTLKRPVATNNAAPGQKRCSVQLTNKNPLTGASNQCFYKPGTGTNNPYYRNIGLLNTNEKIVAGATLGGQPGAHRGDNIYYAFDLVCYSERTKKLGHFLLLVLQVLLGTIVTILIFVKETALLLFKVVNKKRTKP